MPIQDSRGRYTAIAQAFHWIIAALIVTQFVLGLMQEDLPLGMHKLAVLARHKSFGMTVLMLAVLRLAWRLFNPPPPLPDVEPVLDPVLDPVGLPVTTAESTERHDDVSKLRIVEQNKQRTDRFRFLVKGG